MTRTALFLVVASCLLVTLPLGAQNNVKARRVGDITYYGGTLNGEVVTGSAQQLGNTIYYDLTVGGRPVSYTKQVSVGPDSPQGPGSPASMSRQSPGRQVPRQASTTKPEGITYTMQRIGNVIYTYGSNGCVKTTTLVGSEGHITGNCPE